MHLISEYIKLPWEISYRRNKETERKVKKKWEQNRREQTTEKKE